MHGRPALMIRVAEQELRERGLPVARLVIVGLGYNSLWERARRRYGVWAKRFDGEARKLLRTLRRLGARQVVWVTLREPTARTVPPHARDELGQYSWYFPYVNERLRRLDRRRDDLALADWAKASDRPGLTYDSIHLNPKGAALMARTIWTTVSTEARRLGVSSCNRVRSPGHPLSSARPAIEGTKAPMGDTSRTLQDEARYRRERLELYRARLYGGRAGNHEKLAELERAYAGASARLARATAPATEETTQ